MAVKKQQTNLTKTDNEEIHLTFRQSGLEQNPEEAVIMEKEKAKEITRKQARKPLLLRRM